MSLREKLLRPDRYARQVVDAHNQLDRVSIPREGRDLSTRTSELVDRYIGAFEKARDLADPFPTEIAPEYPGQVEVRLSRPELEAIVNGHDNGHHTVDGTALRSGRDKLRTALDQGGDAVVPEPDSSDVMTQRGAGESGSPRPDLSLSTWLTIWADWLASGKGIEDTNRQLAAEDLHLAAERLRGDSDLPTQPSPESGSGVERERDEWRARYQREKKQRKKAQARAGHWRHSHAQQVRRVHQLADELKAANPQPESGSGEEGELEKAERLSVEAMTEVARRSWKQEVEELRADLPQDTPASLPRDHR